MDPEHRYETHVEWLGNRGTGTSSYRGYGRDECGDRRGEGAREIAGSADRAFHGEADRWNPEELLLAALSQCHMLSYLHVATQRGIVVESYVDDAVGTMVQVGQGGHFSEVVLRPRVTISAGQRRRMPMTRTSSRGSCASSRVR